MGFLYMRRDSRLWWVCWSDASGERRRESTGLTDLGAARQVLEELERGVELQRQQALARVQVAADGPLSVNPVHPGGPDRPDRTARPGPGEQDRRFSNHFSRAELERLLSDPRVDRFRRCQWAVLSLTGARIGEVLCLKVRHCDLSRQPLGRLLFAGRWDSKLRRLVPSRSGLPREVPIHPTLAALLGTHLREVLPGRLGRPVAPDDLLFPAVGGTPQQAGTTLAHLQRDLEVLGMRRGNLHTLRRTYFALGRQDGASPRILRAISEDGRPGDPDLPYLARCAEIARLDLQLAREENAPFLSPGGAANGPWPGAGG